MRHARFRFRRRAIVVLTENRSLFTVESRRRSLLTSTINYRTAIRHEQASRQMQLCVVLKL